MKAYWTWIKSNWFKALIFALLIILVLAPFIWAPLMTLRSKVPGLKDLKPAA